MSIRSMPGPQPSCSLATATAPNLAKNGADLWLAAILISGDREALASETTRLIISEPRPRPFESG